MTIVVIFFQLVSKYKIMFSNKVSHMPHAFSDTCPPFILQAVDRSKIHGILGRPRVDGVPGNIVCREGGARG